MAEFASNCPVSRPIKTGWNTDWDLNGWSWSYQYGMFFGDPVDEMIPLRLPVTLFRPRLWDRDQ